MVLQVQGNTNNNVVSIPLLVSLPNGSTAVSDTIDNVPSSAAFINVDIQLMYRTTTPTSSRGTIALILLRSMDGGTTFDDATDSHEILGTFIANSDNTTYIVSSGTGIRGVMPAKWRLAVINNSGAAFDSTAGNFSLKFIGKFSDVI
jgi:hypothetical protein